MALVFMALFGGLVYGMFWLQRRDHLPCWMRVGQAYVGLGLAYVQWIMAQILRPIFWINRQQAAAQPWLRLGAKPGGRK